MRSSLPISRRARLQHILEGRDSALFTFAELVDQYRATYRHDRATHDDLTSAFGALIHRGSVVRSGVVPGRTRRAVRYHFVGRGTSEPNDELQELVVAIVDDHYAAQRCPIATGEVRRALQARGVWPDRFDGLHSVLRVLSETQRLRQASGLSTSGLPAAFWLPSAAPDQCALTSANTTEELRRAIAAAASALGRPVSKCEIVAWLHAQSTAAPLRHPLRLDRVSSVLRNVRDREAQDDPRHGRIHVTRGALTCHGGSPERYSLGDTNSDGAALCRFLDALYAVRPAAELSSIDRLFRTRRSRRPLLDELASVRRAALHAALVEYVGCDDLEHVRDLAQRARRGVHAIAGWARAVVGSYASRRRRNRPLEQTLADIDAVERICRSEHDVSRYDGAIAVVGKSGLATLAGLRELVQQAIANGTLSVSRPQLAFRYARRFPSSPCDRGSAPDRLSAIDRVDAIVEVWSHATDPAVRVRVERWHALLGHVLRDASAVAALDALVPDRDKDAAGLVGSSRWSRFQST